MEKAEQDLAELMTSLLKTKFNEVRSDIEDLKKAILLVDDRFGTLEDQVTLFMSESAVIQARFSEKFNYIEEIVRDERERLTKTRKKLFEVDRKANNVNMIKTILIVVSMLLLYLSKSPIKDFGSLIHMLF